MAEKKTTEHGALTVTEGGEDYDLDLRWAGKRLGLSREDVEMLREEAEARAYANEAGDNSGYGDAQGLADLAARIEAVLP